MTHRLTIAPGYEHMREELEEALLATLCARPGGELREVFRDSRNLVYRTCIGGADLVVKRFKVPVWINRIAYTFLRKSKAQRAFEYGGELLRRGFATPEPVVRLAVMRGGLLHTDFVAYRYLPGPDLQEHYRALAGDAAGLERLGKAFVAFMLRLHAAGVEHRDFNPGNVIVAVPESEEEEYGFALIDINRMRFHDRVLTFEESMDAFDKMEAPPEVLAPYLGIYAAARGYESVKCEETVRKRKKRRHNRIIK